MSLAWTQLAKDVLPRARDSPEISEICARDKKKITQNNSISKYKLSSDYLRYKSYFGVSQINSKFWAVLQSNGPPKWKDYFIFNRIWNPNKNLLYLYHPFECRVSTLKKR